MYTGTFGIKKFPFKADTTLDSRGFVLDRWRPAEDIDRDRIGGIKEVKNGWMRCGGPSGLKQIWFGFEEETMFDDVHSGDYYNLVVVRYNLIDYQTALKAVDSSLSGGSLRKA